MKMYIHTECNISFKSAQWPLIIYFQLIQSMPYRNLFMWLMKMRCVEPEWYFRKKNPRILFNTTHAVDNSPRFPLPSPFVRASVYVSFYFYFRVFVYFFPTVKYPFTLNFIRIWSMVPYVHNLFLCIVVW